MQPDKNWELIAHEQREVIRQLVHALEIQAYRQTVAPEAREALAAAAPFLLED